MIFGTELAERVTKQETPGSGIYLDTIVLRGCSHTITVACDRFGATQFFEPLKRYTITITEDPGSAPELEIESISPSVRGCGS